MIVSIILARGGSAGIPKKNIKNFCGKPLLEWTINHCINSKIDKTFVSSDSQEILKFSKKIGADVIIRPKSLSHGTSSSESGWCHALDNLKNQGIFPKWVVAPQVTSPLRLSKDINRGIKIAKSNKFDSLFSASESEDICLWEERKNNFFCLNYDWKNRKPRQEKNIQYIENGSFYIFRPEILIKHNNRLGGKIGIIPMKFWQMFEIDDFDDFKLCEIIMKKFILKNT